MPGPSPYLHLPGTARAALTFYASVFGCEVELHTLADFNRTDGPADAIAHGYLTGGPVELFAADVFGDQPSFHSEGLLFSLLGASDPATLRRWFEEFSQGGTVTVPLETKPWGAADGQVIDRYGVPWLIGYEGR